MCANRSNIEKDSTIDKTSYPCQRNTRDKKMSPMKMKVTGGAEHKNIKNTLHFQNASYFKNAATEFYVFRVGQFFNRVYPACAKHWNF